MSVDTPDESQRQAMQRLSNSSLAHGSCSAQDLKEAVLQLHSSLGEKSSEHIQQRRPLVRKAAVRVADVKQYNPQFEEEYVAGKDYDPDR